ncbi:MAG: hypothetical protein A3F16_01185 [Deltaproteobacteria bacterium RIFCSPHIGHO2_12_FULL_43_9]|nr:MAG: hypothetical protein A3F16_01185 [Deltaproteobacteria bacterium RIFCSPHIGHO2_12_FULL_43_9]
MFIMFTFYGCAKLSKTPKNTLVVPIEAMPTTLDPRFATDAYSQWLTSLIFDSLVRVNKNLEPEGEAASSIQMLDEKTYLFSLHPDLVFHNGKRVTAEDVVWSYSNYVDPQVASPFAAAFKKIRTINALDKDTIKITLDQPFAPFLVDLSLLKILPKEAGSPPNPSFSKAPIGTGPFKTVLLSQSSAELERVDKSGDRIERVNFILVQDANTRFLKLKQREVDLLQNTLDLHLIPEVKKDDNLVFVSEPGITYQYLIFNFRDPILKNIKVRHAIAHAINREMIIRFLLSNAATEATSLLSPQNKYFRSGLRHYSYDLVKAKKLLDEAGLKDPDGDGPLPRFKLEYKTSNSNDATDLAQAIRDQLHSVGIEINVRTYEWGTFYQDLKTGNFQIASGRLVGITDPDIYFDIFSSSRFAPEGRNRGYYSNKELDDLLERGRVTTLFEKRRPIYDKVQEIVANEVPYLSLWYLNNVAAYRKGISGYEMYPNGSYRFLINIHK